MVRKIIDVEADSLNPTVIDVVVTIDVDTEEVSVWRYDENRDRFYGTADLWIGHNILGFDAPVLRRLAGLDMPDVRCVDTLVCSRLFNQQIRDGHSLGAWGDRLKLEKGEFKEFKRLDDPIAERDRVDRCVVYCIRDCRITLKLFKLFEKHIYSDQWRESLRLEHDTAVYCRELHEAGFEFNRQKAQQIHDELAGLVGSLSEALRKAFPPRAYAIREIVPKSTKFGTLHRGDFRWWGEQDLSPFSPGAAFTRIGFEEFNPGSPRQVVQILNEAGWKPFEKTDGYKDCEKELRNLRRSSGKRERANADQAAKITELEAKCGDFEIYGWKVSEENLETLPEDAPEGCRLFVKWRMLSKRLQTLEEWFDAYDPNDNRIHGSFQHIGAWTHRMAHSGPNMGNVPSVDSKYHAEELKVLARTYGHAMRSCWTVSPGRRLVGVDAEGIQLRILAHYMNDAEFTEALISGKKNDEHPELSTDVHTLNAVKLGFDYTVRPRAKTFIYAWLLGAGLGKVSKILGITLEAARAAVESFIRGYPGLYDLKVSRIIADAERGYFENVDGRLIRSDEYHMLAGYLQAGESSIMKKAAQRWKHELTSLGIWYRAVNIVHDEYQTEVEDDLAVAEHVASVQMKAITWAGEQYGLNCPLAGSRKIGYTWMETH